MPRLPTNPRRRRLRLLAGTPLWTAVLALAISPAASQALSPSGKLIRDCLTNGRILGHYSPKDYSQALANLGTDVTEYSDCARVIRQAQLTSAAGGGATSRAANLPGGSGGGSSGSGSGGSAATGAAAANPRQDPLTSAAPTERAAVDQARLAGASPLDVGGQLLRPGVVATRTSSIFNALPTPLLIALGALALLALAVCARRTRNIVRARRSG